MQAAFASNFVPLGAGGGGGNVIVEGQAVARGEEPGITFIGATPRLAPDAQRRAHQRPRSSPSRKIDADAGRADQPDDGQAAVAGQDAIGRRFRITGDSRTGSPSSA